MFLKVVEQSQSQRLAFPNSTVHMPVNFLFHAWLDWSFLLLFSLALLPIWTLNQFPLLNTKALVTHICPGLSVIFSLRCCYLYSFRGRLVCPC